MKSLTEKIAYRFFMYQQRERARTELQAANIPTAVHYPIPMQKQPCFASMAIANQALHFRALK